MKDNEKAIITFFPGGGAIIAQLVYLTELPETIVVQTVEDLKAKGQVIEKPKDVLWLSPEALGKQADYQLLEQPEEDSKPEDSKPEDDK